jgi:RIO-like serine/threonine protein kinase
MAEQGKPRPALFRALGKQDPPPVVLIDGEAFALREIFKHDSWAATAVYQSATKRIVCKFNRQQSVLGMPMGWLGRWLARREAAHYRRLAGLANVPALCGAVTVDGVELPNAVAHDYVHGHPLSQREVLPESFLRELQAAFAEVHRRQMAYVDLHKRENILVGEDGRPYLIDFQVSWMLSEKTDAIQCWLLEQLQRIDCYHLRKHERTLHIARTGEIPDEPARPWWIRLHRVIAVPLREARRRFLVLLGVRKKKGRSHTEHFAEDAVRQETKKAAYG